MDKVLIRKKMFGLVKGENKRRVWKVKELDLMGMELEKKTLCSFSGVSVKIE
jgi:hypothetical protein